MTLGVETRLANAKGPPAGEQKEISHDLTEIRQQKDQSRMLAQSVNSGTGLPQFESQVWLQTVGFGDLRQTANLCDPDSSSIAWKEQQNSIPWGWVLEEVVSVKCLAQCWAHSRHSVYAGCYYH